MLDSFAQYGDTGLFILRLAIAIIFIYHSIPKLKNAKGMSAMVGMPAGMIMILGIIELLSGLGLLLGIYMGLSALLLSIVMIGAIGMKTMKWNTPFSAMDKMGWEFDLILLAGSLAILLGGGGSVGL